MAEETKKPKKKEKREMPRRAPSIVIPVRQPVYITADKVTCVDCGCFPEQEKYKRHKKLSPCMKSPLTLYELAAAVVDALPWPKAFDWTIKDVVKWITDIGFLKYKNCIIKNKINGRRLLMLEDPSKWPRMNVVVFDDILILTSAIRDLFSMDFIRFLRCVNLPRRRPLIHCTWFKSRTGPSWGIRMGWDRSELLRQMQIIKPAPTYMDHWDYVWYIKNDFPKEKIARIKVDREKEKLPRYMPTRECTKEIMVPRKFRFDTSISESKQFIWMEEKIIEPTPPKKKYVETKTGPKIIIPNIKKLKGQKLVLAKRLLPKKKFLE